MSKTTGLKTVASATLGLQARKAEAFGKVVKVCGIIFHHSLHSLANLVSSWIRMGRIDILDSDEHEEIRLIRGLHLPS